MLTFIARIPLPHPIKVSVEIQQIRFPRRFRFSHSMRSDAFSCPKPINPRDPAASSPFGSNWTATRSLSTEAFLAAQLLGSSKVEGLDVTLLPLP